MTTDMMSPAVDVDGARECMLNSVLLEDHNRQKEKQKMGLESLATATQHRRWPKNWARDLSSRSAARLINHSCDGRGPVGAPMSHLLGFLFTIQLG